MWIWWKQKSIGTQAFWGVYLWLNEEIESYLKSGISDETQIAVVVWLQWVSSVKLLYKSWLLEQSIWKTLHHKVYTCKWKI